MRLSYGPSPWIAHSNITENNIYKDQIKMGIIQGGRRYDVQGTIRAHWKTLPVIP